MGEEPATNERFGPLHSRLRWSTEGLLPAIIQDADSGQVLMMAWMDRQALETTLESGQTHFYSRSRKAAWHKGATSGHVQHVRSIDVDCDADVLLIQVEQIGGACHEGYRTCFFRRINSAGELAIIRQRVFEPESVYRRPEPKPDPSEPVASEGVE